MYYQRVGTWLNKIAESHAGWELVIDTSYFTSALINSWVVFSNLVGPQDAPTFGSFCFPLVNEIPDHMHLSLEKNISPKNQQGLPHTHLRKTAE